MIKSKIPSLIPNSKILSKVKFGTPHKRKGEGGYYFYLYKTTCLINGMVYVGVLATKLDPALDRHIGDGIRGKKAYGNINPKELNLRSLFNEYGRVHFVREDLKFFDNYSDMVKAVTLIVDQKFVNDQRTLNEIIGNSTATLPIPGQGKIAVELNRSKFQYKQLGRNMEMLALIDCYASDFKMEVIGSMKEAEIRYGYSDKTVSKLVGQKGNMMVDDRFMLMKLSQYSKFKNEDIQNYVNDQFELNKRVKRRRFIKFQVQHGKMKLDFNEAKQLYPEMTDGNLRQLLKTCL